MDCVCPGILAEGRARLTITPMVLSPVIVISKMIVLPGVLAVGEGHLQIKLMVLFPVIEIAEKTETIHQCCI